MSAAKCGYISSIESVPCPLRKDHSGDHEGQVHTLMVRVSWRLSGGDDLNGEVIADTGMPMPNPPPTREEMQSITFAAKMAMLKALRLRKRKP